MLTSALKSKVIREHVMVLRGLKKLAHAQIVNDSDAAAVLHTDQKILLQHFTI